MAAALQERLTSSKPMKLYLKGTLHCYGAQNDSQQCCLVFLLSSSESEHPHVGGKPRAKPDFGAGSDFGVGSPVGKAGDQRDGSMKAERGQGRCAGAGAHLRPRNLILQRHLRGDASRCILLRRLVTGHEALQLHLRRARHGDALGGKAMQPTLEQQRHVHNLAATGSLPMNNRSRSFR